MTDVINRFALNGKPVGGARYGSGHINETYRVGTDAGGDYICQKINKGVFADPSAVMRNIDAVTRYLRTIAADPREVMTLVRTIEGEPFYVDENGDYWRVYEFVPDTISLDKADSPNDFKESGAAFGQFQKRLAGFDASLLTETIPKFHDTPNRYRQLEAALSAAKKERLDAARAEIGFAESLEPFSHTLADLRAKGVLPDRVTHNDTKLNNVLFDKTTRKGLCVIDLDTVMPGLSVYDFGDSIRFGASTAAEDERDLSLVSFSTELFEAFAEGYLGACDLTAAERDNLCVGAKMMTLECGVRFLTDFLNGDVYFHTARDGQNLDRCRTQFALIKDMEKKWDAAESTVRRLSK